MLFRSLKRINSSFGYEDDMKQGIYKHIFIPESIETIDDVFVKRNFGQKIFLERSEKNELWSEIWSKDSINALGIQVYWNATINDFLLCIIDEK